MLKIPVIKGNINKALKQFKRKFKKTGILKEIRKKQQYIKPSLRKKIEKEKAIFKSKKQQNDE